MRRVRCAALAAAFACWLPAQAAQPGDTAAVIKYLDGLHSLAAHFTQERYDETGELAETAHGDANIERPGRFRWNYTDPYQQLIVSDGREVWVYDQDLAQVTRNKADGARPGTPAELLSAEFDVAGHYTITALGLADGYDWYRLAPKGPPGEFQDIELGMKDGEVGAMRLKDNLGQTTLLHFDHIKRNAPQDAALFKFTPPKGVDVIEGGAP